MGRLTYMSVARVCIWLAVLAALSAMAAACSLDAPITVTDRPLSERVDERRAASAEVVDLAAASTPEPESLAFGQALASGDYLRLTVTSEGTDAALRSGPGPSYDRLTDVPSGAEVLASGNQTGEWVHVMYGDFEGWLRTARIAFGAEPGGEQIVDASEVNAAAVTYEVVGEAVGVNIRTEPNAAAELVSGAPVGTRVVGTGNTEGTWIEVVYEGITGWASGNYLEPINSADVTLNTDE